MNKILMLCLNIILNMVKQWSYRVPRSKPTDLIMIRKASNKFFRHDLQIKHVFDYKTLSARTTPYIAKDLETSFLT